MHINSLSKDYPSATITLSYEEAMFLNNLICNEYNKENNYSDMIDELYRDFFTLTKFIKFGRLEEADIQVINTILRHQSRR